MFHETQGFVRLPNEKLVYKSPSRTTLSLTTPRSYPAHQPIDLHSNDGTLYLTNQRVVYLPKTRTESLQSFSASLLNLHDTHIVVPWFGPNSWQALVEPVPGGNIPAGHVAIELKFTFKEGGAPDFQSRYDQIKERLQQVVSNARESNMNAAGSGPANGVDLSNVHLDELPSYQASGHDRMAPPGGAPSETSSAPPQESRVMAAQGETNSQDANLGSEAPADAPPGYEETQQQSIQAELDRRLGGSR